ncbi:MAG: hypothetical protein U0871_26870 [Gemmataceae bacterium]
MCSPCPVWSRCCRGSAGWTSGWSAGGWSGAGPGTGRDAGRPGSRPRGPATCGGCGRTGRGTARGTSTGGRPPGGASSWCGEYDHPTPLDLVLVVDPWAADPADPAAAERVEWAVSVAASLAVAWAESGDGATLTLAVPGRPPTVRTGQCTAGFARQACRPLATFAPTADVPAFAPDLIRTRTNRTARIVVSTRPGSPVAAAFADAGVPFAAVDPSYPPAWYHPPKVRPTGDPATAP